MENESEKILGLLKFRSKEIDVFNATGNLNKKKLE